MTKPKSKAPHNFSNEHISNAIHGVVVDPLETLRAKLHMFAEQEGHTLPPDGFDPVVKYSYFVKLKEYYEPTYDPNIKGRHMMEVRCICGKVKKYPYRMVMAKVKTSCGCREKTMKNRLGDYKASRCVPPPNLQDLTKSGPNEDGIHGMLKVMSYKPVRNMHKWIVECACGWRRLMSRDTFRRKQTETCGDPRCISLLGQGYTYSTAKRMFPKRHVEDVLNNHNK